MTLDLIAAGASRGLVGKLAAGFAAETGMALAPVFAAAGAVAAKLRDGAPCDVVILTDALLGALGAEGLLAAEPRPIGIARTGIGVPAGTPHPNLADAAALRAALRAAPALYVPDPEISTAGIHTMGVLRALGLADEMAAKLRPFPTGAAAMRALAAAPEPGAIGCTQITEIVETPGLDVVGPLPPPHGLATLYACAIRAGTVHPEAAARLVSLLSGPATRALRDGEGFEPPPDGDWRDRAGQDRA